MILSLFLRLAYFLMERGKTRARITQPLLWQLGDLHTGLHCIRSYTRRCMNIHQRDHFNKLYHGTNEVIHDLCEEGPYQEGTYVL
ncbi:AGAP011666-PA-like protein [Anopheles sinensis]|uniref:AGAP011666-PA-like protein n=1 Tax=Anopheles sinensis TaxID=74873 RepID=A0A084VID6_ANOSI|nr:AGAP011666-PA-like protein [Anopheles sinensis]